MRRKLGNGGDDICGGHAEFLHHHIAGRADVEAVDAECLALGADVFPPDVGDARLDGDALRAGFRKDAFLVFGGLALEALHAGHGDDADAIAELFRGLDAMLKLGTGADEDGGECPGFFNSHIAAAQHAVAALLHG